MCELKHNQNKSKNKILKIITTCYDFIHASHIISNILLTNDEF